jgi:hypothetical protein
MDQTLPDQLDPRAKARAERLSRRQERQAQRRKARTKEQASVNRDDPSSAEHRSERSANREDRRAQRQQKRGPSEQVPRTRAELLTARAEARRARRAARRQANVATRETKRTERRQKLPQAAPSEEAGGQRLWRTTVGRITYYNVPPRVVAPAPIEDLPRTAEIIRNGFVSAREVYNGEGRMKAGRHILGAVHDGDGNLLPEFRDRDERYRDRFTPGRNPVKVDPARLAAAERLPGRHVYLGDLKGHFGHFLLESLPRAWYLTDADPGTRVIFHHSTGVEEFHLGFWKAVFDALDLDISRVTFADRDLVADELVVPSCQYWVNWKGSPGFGAVFDHMRRKIAERWTGDRRFPKKVYLTRRQLRKPHDRLNIPNNHPRKLQGAYRRMILNEEVAEDLFAARGFEIVAPETLPFEAQVMLISQATHVAGLTGSALHMILFNDNPETNLIALHTRHSANQIWLEALRGTRGHHIWCIKAKDENRSPLIDGDVVERALREIP